MSYRAVGDARSPSLGMPPQRPRSSAGSDLNKPLPLPPSPLTLEKRHSRPMSLRGFLRREPPSQLETTHLRPPNQYSTWNTDSFEYHHHSYSRSMPNTPRGFRPLSDPYDNTVDDRNEPAAANYLESAPYNTHPERRSQTMYFGEEYSNPTSDYFDTTPSRSHMNPSPGEYNPTTRDNVPSRARPHTWLSPTEPFTDISQFHLFAEAMTGLPTDTDSPSSSSPPQLQGSLFARRSRNDTIPIPLQYPQYPQESQTQPTHSHRSDWQNFEPPPNISSRSVAGPSSPLSEQWRPSSHMQALDLELGMLGLEDEYDSEDELPDYAQSQAEMSARKRAEASARARELEARWRGSSGR
ncbi:hypothetical protein T440DRAFT_486025 [Plenodomus tracheiphilus IPT5]|uniref:Uncharacterized protein n=1 Tax=Plenodomus tracheiphilus IPT5 TaxID=1408161 RepID=A0A6A7BIC4_9PLEO|nr:hypothetical protein T440DRAFT_486025 [Plenodomus tracheiphilus IPT5]